MRGPTVSLSEILRQTLIACVAVPSWVIGFAMTAVFFARIDSTSVGWLIVAIGAILELAKPGFSLTGAQAWRQGHWIKSGVFWSLSVILSAGSIFAAHGVISTSDRESVTQRAMASADYKDLQDDALSLRKRIDSLTQSMEEDRADGKRTRALQTERRVGEVHQEYLGVKRKIAEYRKNTVAASQQSSGLSSGWSQAWCLVVAIMLEIIGQVATVELMASNQVTPWASLAAKRLPGPDPEAPTPKKRRLRLVSPQGQAPGYGEAKRLVKRGLPATHADLMAAMGCSRSSAQRYLRRMREEGILALRGHRNHLIHASGWSGVRGASPRSGAGPYP